MQQSPLHSFHLDYDAQMVDYAGWEMPLRYQGVQDEVRQVRSAGGVFDVSHMGRLSIKGRHARRLLERACTRRIHDMKEGQVRYSLVCNEEGGVKDDVLVYRLDDDDFMVVVNAANRDKIVSHLKTLIASAELAVKMEDRTEKTAMIAMQGPRVMDLISSVSSEIPTLKKYRFTQKNLLVVKILVSRTGYTGEDGVEAILPSSAIGMAMKLMLKDVDMSKAEADLKPAGLAARDVLRLEAGMPLYGHELTEDTNALASGLGFAIAMDKHEHELGERFVGQDAMEKVQASGGPVQTLVGLKLDSRRTARQGAEVSKGDTKIGSVTSGCLSPTLDASIAMAYVKSGEVEPGSNVVVEVGKTTCEAQVVPLPFYKRG